MSEPTTPSAPQPPSLGSELPSRHAPLGTYAIEKEPVTGLVQAFETILRQPRRVMFHLFQPGETHLRRALLIISILLVMVYGLVMGTFSGGQQYWAVPLKVAAGLLASAAICLPSLYIFSCLSGAHARLADVWGLLTGLLALMAILLTGFAPVALVFSTSTTSVAFMGFLHLMFWIIAVYFGVTFLKAGFGHLRANSDSGVNTWVFIFLLVMLQMTCMLRPLIGSSPDLVQFGEKKFFLVHWMQSMDGNSSGRRTY